MCEVFGGSAMRGVVTGEVQIVAAQGEDRATTALKLEGQGATSNKI
jgi:hypothetical protein